VRSKTISSRRPSVLTVRSRTISSHKPSVLTVIHRPALLVRTVDAAEFGPRKAQAHRHPVTKITRRNRREANRNGDEEHDGEGCPAVPMARARRDHPDATPGAPPSPSPIDTAHHWHCCPEIPSFMLCILYSYCCCHHPSLWHCSSFMHIGCSQAHAAEADADLTKITSKVFFDIQIDGKPEGLFVCLCMQILRQRFASPSL